MSYSIFFQRTATRKDIALAEWLSAVDRVPGVRRANDATADPHDWVGYFVNPKVTSGQFHQRPDRAFDAEVFFPEEGRWRRALYWNLIRGSSDHGVITFTDCPASVEQSRYPVGLAAAKLAVLLDAELVGEDDTFYE